MKLDTPSGPLKLAANLKWMFTELPFEARFAAAAEAGFTAVEYASPYPYAATRLRALLDDAGLEQILINTPAGAPDSATGAGAAVVPGAVEEFRRGVDSALEYASTLGANLVHVMAGACPPEQTRAQCFATYVANIAWAADQARGTGITLVLEAINKRDVPRYGLASMEAAADVARAVDPHTLGVLFDFYHAQVDRGNVSERFATLLPVVRHVQIADNPGRNEPGTGEIAYRHVLAAVAASGYDGWIGCEYRPATTTLEGLTWIRALRRNS
ncbi:hydroxypyruvate isomerase [Mycobacterium frederiksbergense]|uniref:Hydroxypyruvate isomerase n=1 Tax=Mycolicibacterium frederiksbergense TaxID=117567 RepID=A0ABT6L4D7_9MYCO|nr:TIM barrel protein [Mycolicibacterium frederiksbergense]MDH6196850.1 hydroxypyruvate isomerase [Mycolicibacterium frederiksbergense]